MSILDRAREFLSADIGFELFRKASFVLQAFRLGTDVFGPKSFSSSEQDSAQGTSWLVMGVTPE